MKKWKIIQEIKSIPIADAQIIKGPYSPGNKVPVNIRISNIGEIIDDHIFGFLLTISQISKKYSLSYITIAKYAINNKETTTIAAINHPS